MIQFKLTKNPFLLFLPFLVFYIILVFIYPTTGTFGDESRYLIYGRYMIDGFLPSTDLNFDHLGDGPGYSILLIPFIAFHAPLIFITVLNAIFFYLSVVLVFKTVSKFGSFRTALIASIFWGCYINSYESIVLINAETLTLLLISAMMFCLSKAFDTTGKSKKYIYFSGLLIGYIALTKVIFGYVLLCMLSIAVILWLFNRVVVNYRKGAFILLIAFFATSPYLIHTYRVTNKVFYWGTFGGNNLYWMTNPDENEYGSWFSDPGKPFDSTMTTTHSNNFEEQIRIKHQSDFEEINKYTGAAQDDASKKIAIRNIKSHPGKFLQNCLSNIGRLLFNFPYSYKLQTPGTLSRLPFTGVLVVLMLFCIIPTFKNWKKIDFSIRFMLLMAFTYFGGSVLGSAETRMFTIIVPILLCWLAFICERAFKIKFKFD